MLRRIGTQLIGCRGFRLSVVNLCVRRTSRTLIVFWGGGAFVLVPRTYFFDGFSLIFTWIVTERVTQGGVGGDNTVIYHRDFLPTLNSPYSP